MFVVDGAVYAAFDFDESPSAKFSDPSRLAENV